MQDSPPEDTTSDAQALRIAQRLRVNTDRLRRVVRASGGEGALPRAQEAVLSLLERRGPLTTADLARYELLRPQTMGAIVGELRTKGLVSKQPHPTDGRRELVHLTDSGNEVIAAVSRVRDRGLANLIQTQLNEEERQQLLRGVEIVESLGTTLP